MFEKKEIFEITNKILKVLRIYLISRLIDFSTRV